MSSSQRRGRGSSTGPVAPLYARLPRGPHRLDHQQVIRHQRARIHGAMVEAVAANGYAATSVREVVALAGVSRRSFYEQFANKQECFLATYDLIAARGLGRIRRGYLASEGAPEERLRTGFEQLTEGIDANWKGARLVIVDAQTVGPAGLACLRGTTATCEQMLSESFAAAPGHSRVSMPVIRGIVGGVQWMLSSCLREGDAGQLPALTEAMLGWALVFRTAAAETIVDGAVAPAGGGEEMRRAPADAGASAADDRSRLLHHALRLAELEGYESLSAARIAQEADVSVDAFFELFADKEECFEAALDALRDGLLAVAADPALRDVEGWPRAVRRAMAELMRYLAERPHYARTIAAGAFAAGPQAAERDRGLMRELATLLLAGAPARAPSGVAAESGLAVDGVAGAIGHTIGCQVASGQIDLLGSLSDQLSFVVLAPFIGAEAAARIVTEDRLLALGAAAFGEVGQNHADEH